MLNLESAHYHESNLEFASPNMGGGLIALVKEFDPDEFEPLDLVDPCSLDEVLCLCSFYISPKFPCQLHSVSPLYYSNCGT
jgi:hypothetical protein